MARNNEQRAARRSERVSDQRAQEFRDGLVKPYADMNRAERRKWQRALRRQGTDAVQRVIRKDEP